MAGICHVGARLPMGGGRSSGEGAKPWVANGNAPSLAPLCPGSSPGGEPLLTWGLGVPLEGPPGVVGNMPTVH